MSKRNQPRGEVPPPAIPQMEKQGEIAKFKRELREQRRGVKRELESRGEDSRPSTSWVEWLWTEPPEGTIPEDTDRVGKWLVYVGHDYVDETWASIKQATEAGQLGTAAKVSTLLTFNGHSHVICVYTYDGLDRQDVTRVGAELRALGIMQRMSYKLDSETLAGHYASTGDKVSLYVMKKEETLLRDA